MKIRIGYEMIYDCPQPTPMILCLSVHSTLSTAALVRDTGKADVVAPQVRQTPVEELPDETLLFPLGSRYCETDRLSETVLRVADGAAALLLYRMRPTASVELAPKTSRP